MSTGDRNRIYTHLARYLPCGKETLMKRGKKLRLDMEDTLKEPIERLREGTYFSLRLIRIEHTTTI